MKYIALFVLALSLTGCHYRYDWDMLLKGDGGFADRCPKKCEKNAAEKR